MLKLEDYETKGKKGQVSGETRSQIKRLIADLRSYNGVVRREARQTLAFIGKQAVDCLIPLLKDPDDEVRWEAAKALADIADPKATSELVTLLMDHNYGVRWLAAEALISIGRDALPPLLEKLTQHSDSSWLRSGAHHVLHSLAQKAPDLKDVAGPVMTALEGFEPEIGCLGPAYAALDKLRGSFDPLLV